MEHDPSGRLLDLLLELTALLGDDMDRALSRDGLTRSRAHVLWVLRDRGPITQKTLADALRVSPRTITGLVDGLVATGFVTREPHPTDRRAALVSFTGRGAATAAAFEDGHRDLARSLVGDLPADGVDDLVEGLSGVVARLRNRLDEGSAP